jgi:mono/diheme cytochrome c family protein
MKYTRKFGTIILLLVMVPFLLSGCGGSDSSTESEPAEPAATEAPADEEVEAPADEKVEAPAEGEVAAASSEAEQLYRDNCVKCHGLEGLADGSSIGSLNFSGVGNMSLANLEERSDDELFTTISGGKGLEMPPWQLALSEDERWEVIAYIRTLAK